MRKIYYACFFLSIFCLYSQNDNIVIRVDGKTLEINKDNSLVVYKEFYASGKLKISGFKKDDKFEGLFEYYDEKEKLIYRILYKENRILYTNLVGHKNGFFSRIKTDPLD